MDSVVCLCRVKFCSWFKNRSVEILVGVVFGGGVAGICHG